MPADSSPLEILAHVPGITIPSGAAIDLGPLVLEPLPVEEWLALEDPAFVYRQRHYDSQQRVFARRVYAPDAREGDSGARAGAQDDMDAALAAFDAELSRVEVALMLGGAQLPPFGLTGAATYVRGGTTEAVTRRFGPSERELLLDTLPAHAMGSDDVARLRVLHGRLARAGITPATDPELFRLVDLLRLQRHPLLGTADVLTHFVVVIEDMLSVGEPQPRGKIKSTFVRRAALLHAAAFEYIAEYQQVFERLYRARSAIVHGGGGTAALSAIGIRDPDQSLRVLTVLAFDHVLSVRERHPTMDAALTALVVRLDATPDGDPGAYAALAAACWPPDDQKEKP